MKLTNARNEPAAGYAVFEYKGYLISSFVALIDHAASVLAYKAGDTLYQIEDRGEHASVEAAIKWVDAVVSGALMETAANNRMGTCSISGQPFVKPAKNVSHSCGHEYRPVDTCEGIIDRCRLCGDEK